MNKKKKAFTIVELVIVIAVVAILAAVLIPTFITVVEKANESSARSEAKGLVDSMLAELNGDTGTKDFIVFVTKGGSIYVYGFAHDYRVIRAYHTLPYGDAEGELSSQVETILAAMVSAGEVTATTPAENDWYHKDNMATILTECGYDASAIAIRADYIINSAKFFMPEDDGGEGGDAPVTPPPSNPSGFTWDDEKNQLLFNGDPYKGTVPEDDPDLPPQALPGIYYVEGIPYVSSVYDEGSDEHVFTIPAGAVYYDELKLDYTNFQTNLNESLINPGSFGGYGVRIIDNSGKFSISEISLENDSLNSYFTSGDKSEIPNDFVPHITGSTAFIDYMTTVLGYSSVDGTNVNDYIAKYEAGTLTKTFTEYLKEKYSVDDLMDIPFIAVVSQSASATHECYEFYDSSVGEGLVAGSTIRYSGQNIDHVEPEVIYLLMHYLYDDSVMYSFMNSNDTSSYSTPIYKLYFAINGSGDLYDYSGEAWKSDAEASGWDCHSIYELINGIRLPDNSNFTTTTSGGVTTIAGSIYVWWHACIAGDAYQGISITTPSSFIMTMTNSNPTV